MRETQSAMNYWNRFPSPNLPVRDQRWSAEVQKQQCYSKVRQFGRKLHWNGYSLSGRPWMVPKILCQTTPSIPLAKAIIKVGGVCMGPGDWIPIPGRERQSWRLGLGGGLGEAEMSARGTYKAVFVY